MHVGRRTGRVVVVVVERSLGMRDVGGSTPGRIKQLLCLARAQHTDWPARSQDNGLSLDTTAYPWRCVSVG